MVNLYRKQLGCFVVQRALVVLFLALVGASVAIAAAAAEKPPEVTHDGLHLKKDSRLRRVYVRPGASLAAYDKVMILDCFVAFKKNWQREHDMYSRISSDQMERIKKHVATEFRKVFVKELQRKDGYEVVTEPAQDVLLVRPAIIDLVINAPDENSVGRETSFTASAGQMTLYVELYDSATSEIIVRAIDPEAGQSPGGFIQVSNAVTNTAQADAIMRKWARLLRERLDEAHRKK